MTNNREPREFLIQDDSLTAAHRTRAKVYTKDWGYVAMKGEMEPIHVIEYSAYAELKSNVNGLSEMHAELIMKKADLFKDYVELQEKLNVAVEALEYVSLCEDNLKVFYGKYEFKRLMGKGYGVKEALNKIKGGEK